jgi:predicted metalloprotease with PDZ domain
VPIHELAHALLPAVDSRDVWLSEGLATYHQELLQARAGLYADAPTSWHELLRGFRRGQETAHQRPLVDVSGSMSETHSYTQVYWGGAALLWLADVDVRARTHGAATLEDFARKARALHPLDDRARRASELIDDVIAGDDVNAREAALSVRAMFDAHAHAPFPPIDNTLRALGVVEDPHGVTFSDAPLASVRDALMAAQ